MECLVNSTAEINNNLITHGGDSELCSSKNVSGSAVFSWLLSRLRIFLYLSNPYEESFEFEHQVTDYHTEIFPLLVSFVFLEWLILWLKGKPIPLLGDSIASSSMILMMECTRILTRGIEHTAYVYIYKHYRVVDLNWNSAITWYLAAVFVDFCYYWGHRASHEINFLWAHHQAHHSSETYTLVNTFRLPFLQDWLYSFAYLPIAMVISPAHYLVHLQLNLLYQFWLHTELVGKLGPVEWIFNTPSHHQIHHGSNRFCLDRNYGAWLIIWDRMFGTFQENEGDEEIVYGLVDQVQSFNPLYLQLFYFKKIYQKWCLMDGWKNKLSSLMKGPGWTPGSPWTGYIERVSDVKNRKRYSYSSFPLWKSVYVFFHFIIILLAYECVSLFRERMSATSVFIHLAYFIFSATTIGMLYDGHSLAPIFELLRCSIFFFYSQTEIPILSNSISWSGLADLLAGSMETQIYFTLRCYFFVSTVIWALLSIYLAFKETLLIPSKMKVQ